jgi:hypothetical protein
MDCSNGWAVTIRAATYAGRIQRFPMEKMPTCIKLYASLTPKS